MQLRAAVSPFVLPLYIAPSPTPRQHAPSTHPMNILHEQTCKQSPASRTQVQEDAQPGMLHIFVRLAVRAAMERSFREREAISLLLVDLVPAPVPEAALGMAFARLLSTCEDLILDIPDAVHMLTLFLARLVVDEVVPPMFLTRVLELLKADSLGVVVVRNTGRLLSSAHAAERVLGVRSATFRSRRGTLQFDWIHGLVLTHTLARGVERATYTCATFLLSTENCEHGGSGRQSETHHNWRKQPLALRGVAAWQDARTVRICTVATCSNHAAL